MKTLKKLTPLIFVVLITALPLSYGLFRFPKFIGDEGIYISQAWWIANFKRLGPYTYWYDHFPLGWLQIGLWQKLTGGPFTFGLGLYSGRIFMTIITSLSSIPLYLTIKKLTNSKFISALGILLFALSPLSIILHRQTLLDNIASFWLILSLYLLVVKPRNGRNIIFSTISLALAILSKESSLFFIPAYLLGIYWLNAANKYRKYLLLTSGITLGFALSLFPLLALLKGEFFAAPGRVSMLETLIFQATRGTDIPLWNKESELAKALNLWITLDPFLITAGLAFSLLNLITRWKDKASRTISLLTLSFISFLARGGIVLAFYIIPLIPLLIIQICLALKYLQKLLKQAKIADKSNTTHILLLILILAFYHGKSPIWYKFDATSNQIQAIEILKGVENRNSVIITDEYAFLDLRFSHDNNDLFPYAIMYTKADTDPDIRDEILSNNPNSIDYILETSYMEQNITADVYPLLKKARNSMNATHELKPGVEIPDTWSYLTESVTIYEKPAPILE